MAGSTQQSAPPPPVYSVQLLVDKGKGKGKGNGWETVQVGTQDYRYHFTGGNDGGGRIRVNNHDGRICVRIELLQRKQDNYSISLVQSLVDPNNQFTPPQPVSGTNNTVWEFENINDRPQQGYYLIKVADGNANGVIIDCDPMITNEPR